MKKLFNFFITSSKIRDWIIILTIASIAGCVIFFLSNYIIVGILTQRTCNLARTQYSKSDCVDAIVAELEDSSVNMKQRNHDVWALGQIGDERALPALQQYYEGGAKQCDRDHELCQYELEKAIALIESDVNFTHYFRFKIK